MVPRTLDPTTFFATVKDVFRSQKNPASRIAQEVVKFGNYVTLDIATMASKVPSRTLRRT
jgi:hypothetical protein